MREIERNLLLARVSAPRSFSLATLIQEAVHLCDDNGRSSFSDYTSKGNPAYCSASDACACSEAYR